MTEATAVAYATKYPQGAKLSVSRDRIEPSVHTIHVEGIWWTDGRHTPRE